MRNLSLLPDLSLLSRMVFLRASPRIYGEGKRVRVRGSNELERGILPFIHCADDEAHPSKMIGASSKRHDRPLQKDSRFIFVDNRIGFDLGRQNGRQEIDHSNPTHVGFLERHELALNETSL